MAIKLSSLNIGDIIKFRVNGTPTEFIVVHQGLPSADYDSSCSGTWFLMKDLYEIRRVWDSTDNDYKNSDIHLYLNGTFCNMFDSSVQEIIKQVKIPYHDGKGNSGSVFSGANGLSAKLFFLSGYEVGWTKATNSVFPEDGACLSYFSDFSAKDSRRIGYYNGAVMRWWLRSPATNNGYSVRCVYTDGGFDTVNYNSPYGDVGVRPAFILPSSTTITENDDGSYGINSFPSQPESNEDYTLIDTYTTSQTWTAPEDGWYKIEVHGASGKGGNAGKSAGDVSGAYYFSTGSGGGGSGYACSIVKLNQNDSVVLTCGATGNDTLAIINSTHPEENSHTLKVTSGGNGSNSGNSQKAVNGGSGGIGSGGNIEYGNGSSGSKNTYSTLKTNWSGTGATGGNPYNSNGNAGGNGGNVTNGYAGSGAAGSAGFIKIYRGNSNNAINYNFVTSIESTGTQYIDTGFKPSYKTRVVADIEGINAAENFVFGVRDTSSGSSPRQFGAYRRTATTIRNFYFGTAVDATLADASPRTIVDSNRNILHWGDKLTVTNTAVSSGVCTNTLYLFAMNSVGSPIGLGSFKLYSCKIYDDDVLIHDYVPCVKNGEEAGLYDKIENKFYSNVGTGEFLWYDECNRDNMSEKNLLPKSINSDGTIYNDIGYKHGYYYSSSSKAEAPNSDLYLSGLMPVSYGDTIYLKNIKCSTNDSIKQHYRFTFFDKDFNYIGQINAETASDVWGASKDTDNNIISFPLTTDTPSSVTSIGTLVNIAYFRFAASYLGPDSIITVNAPIRLGEHRVLEYIQSTGTQYIDTGYKPSYNSRVVVDVSDVPATTSFIFGTRDGSSSTSPNQLVLYRSSATTIRYDYFGTSKSASLSDASGRAVVIADANTLTWGDVTITNTAVSSGTCPNTLLLFALNNNGTISKRDPFKLHSCQIYENDTLIRDFVPVKNEDGAVGLYDRVECKFYTNAGTDSFIAGPETGVIMNYLMDDLKCYIVDGIPQLNYYSYSSVNSYVIERSVNNREFKAIETKTAKTVDSCNYIDENIGNVGSVQYRVKAVSGDYESEYLYTDIYSLYKISTYTNLIVGGVL